MGQFPARHPWLWLCFTFFVVWLPQWAASAWSLFSTEPLVVVVSNKLQAMTMPTFSPYWITIPLGIGMFLYLLYELRQQRSSHGFVGYSPRLKIESPQEVAAVQQEQTVWERIRRGERVKELFRKLELCTTRGKRLRLYRLRDEGVQLRNEVPNNHVEWYARFDNWHKRLLEASGSLDQELKASLCPLNIVREWNVGFWVNDSHRQQQNWISELLDRVEKYLDRTRPS